MTPAATPPAGGQAPAFPTATSITPSDTSTSTVLKPTGPQIQCGKVGIKTTADVVYSTPTLADGKQLPLKMDILAPETEGKKPLVIHVTGGGFIMAAKENSLNLRTYTAEAGFVVASIQYRTTLNGAVYTDGVADVKSAVRYLREHADQYGIDPAKVSLWGESAGGYLVAMAGTTNGLKQFDVGDNLDQSSDVQAVIDKFGAADLSKIADDFDPQMRAAFAGPDNPVAQYVNGPTSGKSLGDDPAAVARANPITYVDGTDPAFLLLHGNADHLISPSQTLSLHTALRAAGVGSTRYVLDGADHGDLAFLTGNSTAALPWSTEEVMVHQIEFLRTKLGATP